MKNLKVKLSITACVLTCTGFLCLNGPLYGKAGTVMSGGLGEKTGSDAAGRNAGLSEKGDSDSAYKNDNPGEVEESGAASEWDYSGIYTALQTGGSSVAGKVYWDYPEDEVFFEDPMAYNADLSNVSILLSMLCYSSDGKRFYIKTPEGDKWDILDIMTELGFEDAEDINVPKDPGVLDIHRTEVFVGHRKVCDGENEKTVLAMMVRGTNGTIYEWTSNFDMGNEYTDETDWKERSNHAGFEITSNNTLELVKEYMAEHEITADSYWISGHSRGAAVANLCAAELVDTGAEVRAYTFAAPGVSISNTVSNEQYGCIFNLVNRDDLIPRVPFASWGYGLFGKSAILSPDDELKKAYKEAISTKGKPADYEGEPEWLDKLVDALALMIPREAGDTMNVFTLGCEHVTGIKGSGISFRVKKSSAERYFSMFPESLQKKSHIREDSEDKEYSLICIPLSGIMDIMISMFRNNDMSGAEKVEMMLLLGSNESVAQLLSVLSDSSGNAKLVTPHMPYTYFLLQKEGTASDYTFDSFKNGKATGEEGSSSGGNGEQGNDKKDETPNIDDKQPGDDEDKNPSGNEEGKDGDKNPSGNGEEKGREENQPDDSGEKGGDGDESPDESENTPAAEKALTTDSEEENSGSGVMAVLVLVIMAAAISMMVFVKIKCRKLKAQGK